MNKISVDLVLKDVNVFNSYYKKFFNADVSILDGRIFYIDKNKNKEYNSKEAINCSNKYMIPGFIDIHMHIESSMMTPTVFCEKLAEYGVTTIVSEPHEMANAAGIDGINAMIESAKSSPIDVYYAIPSCVPSTNSDLETTGGSIGFNEMKELLNKEDIICVGEVMNYKQIINPNNLEITKFIEYLKQKYPFYIIEGHCPKLTDLDLAKFLYLGINADHTEHTLDELIARFENGMFVEIQEKMMKKEIIDYIKNNNLYEHFCFVTDDVMADEFYEKGHINTLVKMGIKLGLTKEDSIYAATFTPARRMNLTDRGCIAPGKLADFILLDNIDELNIISTYKKGKLIYNCNHSEQSKSQIYKFPPAFYKSIKLDKLKAADFKILIKEDVSEVNIKAIEVKDGSTRTTEVLKKCEVKNHYLNWDKTDCLLISVIERYGKNKNMSFGFVTGDCIKVGAVASTYAHDHHNLLVVGKNIDDILLAVNTVISLDGGIVVTNENQIKAQLQLNIGGILSDKSVEQIGADLKLVRQSLINQGYKHYNPIMSLCTLSLPVSPELKITDKGLIDVNTSQIVPFYTI